MRWDLAVWARGGCWRALAVLLAPAQLATVVMWVAAVIAVEFLPIAAAAVVIFVLVPSLFPDGEAGAPASVRDRGACEPAYPDDCLDPNATDYDCELGSGDGPRYVHGPVTVKGYDPFGLDDDGDGVGCER